MKKLIAVLIVVFGFPVFASATINLGPTESINLAYNEPSLEVSISYPGKGASGVCGIELRTKDFSVSSVMDQLQIKKGIGVEPKFVELNYNVLFIDLSAAAGTYYSSVEIKTKSGKTLKSVLEEILPIEHGEKAVLVTSTCK